MCDCGDTYCDACNPFRIEGVTADEIGPWCDGVEITVRTSRGVNTLFVTTKDCHLHPQIHINDIGWEVVSWAG